MNYSHKIPQAPPQGRPRRPYQVRSTTEWWATILQSAECACSSSVPTTSMYIHMNWRSNYLSIMVGNGFVRRLYYPKRRWLPQIKSNQNLPNLNTDGMNSNNTNETSMLLSALTLCIPQSTRKYVNLITYKFYTACIPCFRLIIMLVYLFNPLFTSTQSSMCKGVPTTEHNLRTWTPQITWFTLHTHTRILSVGFSVEY
jgi:hypothetical protein